MGIYIPLRTLCLDHQSNDSGKRRSAAGGPAYHVQSGIRVAETVYAIASGTDEKPVMVWRSRKSQVRHVSGAVVRDPCAYLPGRLRVIDTGAATARSQSIHGSRIVPDYLRDIRHGRTRKTIVRTVPIASGSLGEGGAPDGGDIGQTGG